MKSLSPNQIRTLRFLDRRYVGVETVATLHQGTIGSLMVRHLTTYNGKWMTLTEDGLSLISAYSMGRPATRKVVGPLTERVASLLHVAKMRRMA